MRFLFLSYINTPEFKRPEDWIKRIRPFFAVVEALGERHTVISIEQIDFKGKYRFNGVNTYFLNYGPKTVRFPLRMHRFVRGLEPDVVIVHGLHFPLQVILLRLALGRRTRILLQSHADRPPAGWRKAAQWLADRCTDAYLFTSRVMAGEWIEKGLIRSEQKIRELMVGSSVLPRKDRDTARKRTGCTGDPIFVWAGRLNDNKDPITLTAAFLAFAKTRPGARLYMIYHTSEMLAEIKALVDTSPCSNSIVLVGKVGHDEMSYWFSAADFVISTSHAEAFGLAVVEAMSCGCIPIITDIPSYRKITGEGRCGLLFEPGNAEALAGALSTAITLDRQEEQQKVADQFAEQLSFRAIADRLYQIGNSM